VAAGLYFTGGKVSQFFLGAQFFSGFNDNKAKTVESRIQQKGFTKCKKSSCFCL